MSKAASETDDLYAQLHRRMVESGEWDRFLRLLTSKLSEHGWVDEMRHRAKERARSMDTLSFRLILEDTTMHAHSNVPPAVKREVVNMLRQYIRDQVEK